MKRSPKNKWYLSALILTVFILAGCGQGKAPAEAPTGQDPVQPAITSQPKPSSEAGIEPAAGSTTGTSPAAGSTTGTDPVPGSTTGTDPVPGSQTGTDPVPGSQLGSSPAAGSVAPGDSESSPSDPSGSFTALHGALSVEGACLTDQNGDPIRLYGMSTHGIAWFPQYVSYDTFCTLRDDWNTNCVRLALYSDEYNGYSSGGDQEELTGLVRSGIDYATELGMYVIVDWHVLHDQDPNVHKEDALDFFREISSLYRDHTNILYEICNEPNGYATWDSVRSYADEVIPVIRENDEDAVILVGSPSWSQNIDEAAASPLEFDNVMYTLHFYAATHTDDLRNRLETCVNNGLPVFVSEFGMCDASGNGGNDFVQAEKWMELLDEYQISFFCWSLANKDETCCVLNPGCEKTSGWSESDLSESGRWIRERFIATRL